MPRNRSKVIQELDHAFELALLLLSIILAIMAQFTVGEYQEFLPPIIGNIRRLSIVFIFPTILTIIAWITIYFINSETWKMRLRTYAWGSIILLTFFEISEFYVICRPSIYPPWLDFLMVLFLGPSVLFPVFSWWLIGKVLERYQIALKENEFFKGEGKLAKLKRRLPFLISWGIFWLAFYWATLV